jgi:hypothetical protein
MRAQFIRKIDPKQFMDIGLKTWDNLKSMDILLPKNDIYIDGKGFFTYSNESWNTIQHDMIVLVSKVERWSDPIRGNIIEIFYFKCWDIQELKRRQKGGENSLTPKRMYGTKEQYENRFNILQRNENSKGEWVLGRMPKSGENLIAEVMNFERGLDPKSAMDIGIKTWDKIKPGYIFVLNGPKVYLDKPLNENLSLWEELAFLTVDVDAKIKEDIIYIAYWACLGIDLAIKTREDVKNNSNIKLGKTYIKGTKEQLERTFKILQRKDETKND